MSYEEIKHITIICDKKYMEQQRYLSRANITPSVNDPEKEKTAENLKRNKNKLGQRTGSTLG